MDIAYFVTAFPVISQTFVLNQITGLIDRGHDVTIYARRPGDDAPHPDVTRYGLAERTRGCPVLSANVFARGATAVKLLARTYRRRPMAALRAANVARFGYRAASGELLFAAEPMLDANHDLWHAHFAPNGITLALLRDAGLIHGRVVTTFHDYGLTWYLKKWGDDVYSHLFEHSELILAISDWARRRIIELGCPAEKVVVHHMGVDCGRFAPQLKQRRADEPLRLLSVGRLTEKKGIEYAIRAVAKLRDTGIPFTYTHLGGGDLQAMLEQLVRELDVSDIVHLCGPRTQDEVATALHEADVFVAPSVTAADGDAEGIPVVLMEAMAAGLPVVSTRHAAIPELVEDQRSGLLVDERDADALADCLHTLLRDDDTRRRMGARGRAVVEREFNIDSLNDILVERFQQLL